MLKAVLPGQRGKTATLGKVYASDAPAFGTRTWKLIIPGRPTGGPFGDQQLVYNDDYVASELGQIGTQFDGPGHIGVITSKGMYYYNGRFLHDKEMSATGLGPLGVEHVAQKGFVCRGVLLDAVALRAGLFRSQRRTAPAIRESSPRKMCKRWSSGRASLPSETGDCVFLYTGHGDIWHPRDWDKFDSAEKARRIALFNAGEPGFGISACEYLAERKVILTGADTWATEAVGRDLEARLPNHSSVM